jgi:hypothetical protein
MINEPFRMCGWTPGPRDWRRCFTREGLMVQPVATWSSTVVPCENQVILSKVRFRRDRAPARGRRTRCDPGQNLSTSVSARCWQGICASRML